MFSLYISDVEQLFLAAAAEAADQPGAALDLPVLAGHTVPLLLYADDICLLGTSACG